MSRMWLPLLWLLSILAPAPSASAYIPPASFILGKVAGRLASLRGVSATWAGTQYGGAGVDSARAASGRLHLASPDRFRLETQTAQGSHLEIWSGSSRTLRAGERARTEVAPGPHPLPALFLAGSLQSTLSDRGVDLGAVHLGRIGDTICWVIGAKADDPSRPQLWVDKETFLPVRFLVLEREGEGRRIVDWRFADYDPVETSQAFPQTLELWLGGRRVLRLALQTLDVRDLPRDTLFSAAGPGGR